MVEFNKGVDTMSKICLSCGFENENEGKKCTNCGAGFTNNQKGNSKPVSTSFRDYIFIMSLIMPILGIIIYFLMKPADEKLAILAIKGTIIGAIIYSIVGVLFLVGVF